MNEKAEIEVVVEIHTQKDIKVSNGHRSFWVPYTLLDEDSEIYEKSPVGSSGTLIVPFDFAARLGLV